ncbi:MAG: hypothetical protein ABJQ29_05590 [Luteolibacter sp.]
MSPTRYSLHRIVSLSKIPALLLFTTALVNAEPSFQRVQEKPATFRSPAIREASGLAVSPTDPSFLWIINDSGSSNEIHLSNTDGTSRGSLSITGAKNKDWEDLASFRVDGKTYLLIADTGDNGARRGIYTFYIVQEPTLPAEGLSIAGEIPIAWQTSFSLPDGASADIEAVAVDALAGKILILTKRLEPCVLFSIPLAPQDQPPVAEKIAEVVIQAPVLPFVPYRSQPTGMDISPDNTTAAVLTYYGIFLFQRKTSETWPEAFSKRPHGLGPHALPQAEAVAFSRDGKTLYAVSEGFNSPIMRWQVAD